LLIGNVPAVVWQDIWKGGFLFSKSSVMDGVALLIYILWLARAFNLYIKRSVHVRRVNASRERNRMRLHTLDTETGYQGPGCEQ
jgi:hypothetical protein